MLIESGYLLFKAIGQRRIPFAPAKHLMMLQKKHIRRIVTHAYESVPYYRSHMIREGLTPSDFESAEDLFKLPLISKDIVMRDPDSFFSERYRKDNCLELTTSGTTGMPGAFWYDRRSMLLNIAHGERERMVIRGRQKRWRGCREMILRHPDSEFVKIQKYYDQMFGWRRFKGGRVIVSTANPVWENLDFLNHYRPDILDAHGSYLGALYRYAARHRKEIHKPQLATYCGDSLTEEDCEFIGRTLGIPVYSIYRSGEALKIGFTCERNEGFHLHTDLCLLSLINEKGERVGPGERGEVVISNLLNRATVLLNYRLDDLAVLDTGPCQCGRTFPLLKSLEGRKSDIVELPDGNIVDPSRIKNVFMKRRYREHYQVVQQAPLTFTIKVVPVEGIDVKTLGEELKEEFLDLFGQGAQVDIVFVEGTFTAGQEKFRPVVPLKSIVAQNGVKR